MDDSIELTNLLVGKEGSMTLTLPWRNYPGLLIDDASIAAAQRLTQGITSRLSAEGVDTDTIQDVSDTLAGFRKILASPWSKRLQSFPEPPTGKAACVRPAQLARPHFHPEVYVVLHLDTLASLVDSVASASQEANLPDLRAAYSELHSIIKRWYSLLESIPAHPD